MCCDPFLFKDTAAVRCHPYMNPKRRRIQKQAAPSDFDQLGWGVGVDVVPELPLNAPTTCIHTWNSINLQKFDQLQLAIKRNTLREFLFLALLGAKNVKKTWLWRGGKRKKTFGQQ